MEKSFLNNLQWRFATKKFDPERKVSDADMATIRNAMRYAPASSGLQAAYTIYEVVDPAVRAAVREASYGQPQVTDASHFFVFCGRSDLEARAEVMMHHQSEGDQAKRAALSALENMVRGTAAKYSTPEKAFAWSARQAYIALGFGLAACAEMGIDSCPMEGFDQDAVAKVLALPDHIRPMAYLTVGYRAEGPAFPKFRIPESELFVTV